MKVQYKSFDAKRRFGVELEVSNNVDSNQIKSAILKATRREVVVSGGWTQTTGNDFWHIKKDSTCGPLSHLQKDYSWEIASFVASGHKDIKEICNVSKQMVEAGVVTNQNCGFHIHAEVKDCNALDVAVLLAYWIKIEPMICFLVSSKRLNNKHCKLWSKVKKINKKFKYQPNDFWDLIKPTDFSPHENIQRKVSLNLINLASAINHETNFGEDTYNRKTLELRLPDGTLDGDEIQNWIRLFLMFIDSNKNRTMPDDLCPIYDINLFLEIVGLSHHEEFYLLSKSLTKTKLWILSKIMNSEHARNTRKGESVRAKVERKYMSII